MKIKIIDFYFLDEISRVILHAEIKRFGGAATSAPMCCQIQSDVLTLSRSGGGFLLWYLPWQTYRARE